MAAIFKPNTSPKQKLIAYLIFGVLALSLAGMFNNILVDDAISAILTKIALSISLVLIAVVTFFLFKNDSSLRAQINRQNKSPWLLFICFAISIPIFMHLALAQGIPATLHFIFSSESKIEVTVRGKSSSYRSKSCKGGVYLEGYNSFLNSRICGIDRQTWQSLSSGDQLMLHGSKSFFGFHYKRYQTVLNR